MENITATIKRIGRIAMYVLCTYIGIILTLHFVEFSMLTTFLVRVGMIVLAIEIIDWVTPSIDFMDELIKGNTAIAIALGGFLIASAMLINAL